MALGSVRIIKRPPPAKVQFANIQAEIKKQLTPVARQHVQERQKVVADFEHKPKFEYGIATAEKQITLTISLTNESDEVSDSFTVGNLWQALDKTGTRPHIITPNQRPMLRFQTNYNPHTRPIARYGGPGVATGPIVYARQVNHPGFPPRKFSETIGKRLRRQFEAAIDRGVRLGSKKGR